jgi:adenylyl-sulfate kinase
VRRTFLIFGGNMAKTIWLTGLCCSGKTTIAKKIESLTDFINLDGDDLRGKLNSDLGFTPLDRAENLRRVGHIAQLFNEKDINVICSFVSPTEELRKHAFKSIKNLYVIYIKCSAEECERRDVKGMWKKARTGEIPMFTGLTAPYEIPISPDLILDTENSSIEDCVDKLLEIIDLNI